MREIIVYVRARVRDELELVAECQDGVVKVCFIYYLLICLLIARINIVLLCTLITRYAP